MERETRGKDTSTADDMLIHRQRDRHRRWCPGRRRNYYRRAIRTRAQSGDIHTESDWRGRLRNITTCGGCDGQPCCRRGAYCPRQCMPGRCISWLTTYARLTAPIKIWEEHEI